LIRSSLAGNPSLFNSPQPCNVVAIIEELFSARCTFDDDLKAPDPADKTSYYARMRVRGTKEEPPNGIEIGSKKKHAQRAESRASESCPLIKLLSGNR